MATSDAFSRLVQQIQATPSSTTVFNQYVDFNPAIEGPEAPVIRSRNLASYLEALASDRNRDLWLFEAPSTRGAVRTGVPQTSAGQLEKRAAQLGVREGFEMVPVHTLDEAKSSQTSSRVAKFYDLMTNKPVIWNAVMIHTRTPEGRNRAPRPTELLEHQESLRAMCELFSPARVIASGAVAQEAARLLGIPFEAVPHPVAKQSPSFKAMMTQLYGPPT